MAYTTSFIFFFFIIPPPIVMTFFPYSLFSYSFFFFFFYDPATTEIYTLSLHDALPISATAGPVGLPRAVQGASRARPSLRRSEERTSELQSRLQLVCSLLPETKKN